MKVWHSRESQSRAWSCLVAPANPRGAGVRSLRGMSPRDQPRDPPPLHSSLVILGLQRLNGCGGVLGFSHVTKSQPLGASPALTANPSDSPRKCPSQECMGRWTGQLPGPDAPCSPVPTALVWVPWPLPQRNCLCIVQIYIFSIYKMYNIRLHKYICVRVCGEGRPHPGPLL